MKEMLNYFHFVAIFDASELEVTVRDARPNINTVEIRDADPTTEVKMISHFHMSLDHNVKLYR